MKKSKLIYLMFTVVFGSFQVKAFRLDPMTVDFSAEGEYSTKIFRVENEGKDPIAVKIQAFVRQIDEEGTEKLTPTTDFKIFPEQISLAASDSRAVRIVYVGKKEFDRELVYRIVASQLPVSFKEETSKTGINFLFQFVASVYVTNDRFYPKIEVESVTRTDQGTLKVKIVNRGQKHVLLRNVNVELTDANGNSFKLNSDRISAWDSENILPGTRRILTVESQSQFDIYKNKPKIEIRDVP